MSELSPPIPAATLVLMRPSDARPPELLVMERSANMAFAAGALVFPGGRIDPQDHDAAATLGGGEIEAAAIAAIRETIEETGIAPGVEPAATHDQVERIRAGLAAGGVFAELLAAEGLTLVLDRLTPFARWCPNFAETRRFDTLFFVAEAPEGAAAEPDVHEGEGVRAFWASGEAILAEIAAGDAQAIFPTRRNLERLSAFASIDDARASASLYGVPTITPWTEMRDGERWLCIPGDAGYPVTAERLATARRS